jgi:hypothetical protein
MCNSCLVLVLSNPIFDISNMKFILSLSHYLLISFIGLFVFDTLHLYMLHNKAMLQRPNITDKKSK